MNESEYYQNKTNQDRIYSDREFEMRIAKLNNEYDYSLFVLLKPKIYKDGDQWCVLYGDDLQTGIAGFGDTPYLAILDWNKQWNKK